MRFVLIIPCLFYCSSIAFGLTVQEHAADSSNPHGAKMKITGKLNVGTDGDYNANNSLNVQGGATIDSLKTNTLSFGTASSVNGSLSIGTTTAGSSRVKVIGTVAATTFSGDGSQLTGISGVGVSAIWVDSGSVTRQGTVTQNVVIGSTTAVPGQKLTVVGSATIDMLTANCPDGVDVDDLLNGGQMADVKAEMLSELIDHAVSTSDVHGVGSSSIVGDIIANSNKISVSGSASVRTLDVNTLNLGAGTPTQFKFLCGSGSWTNAIGECATVGSGSQVYKTSVNNYTAQFKSLIAGTNIAFDVSTDEITVNAPITTLNDVYISGSSTIRSSSTCTSSFIAPVGFGTTTPTLSSGITVAGSVFVKQSASNAVASIACSEEAYGGENKTIILSATNVGRDRALLKVIDDQSAPMFSIRQAGADQITSPYCVIFPYSSTNGVPLAMFKAVAGMPVDSPMLQFVDSNYIAAPAAGAPLVQIAAGTLSSRYYHVRYSYYRTSDSKETTLSTGSADGDFYNVSANNVLSVVVPYAPDPAISHYNIYVASRGTVTSITRAAGSSTATLTSAIAHGLSTGNYVAISGATQTAYNGVFSATVTGSDTFAYTITGSPTTPALGTIYYGRITKQGSVTASTTSESTWNEPLGGLITGDNPPSTNNTGDVQTEINLAQNKANIILRAYSGQSNNLFECVNSSGVVQTAMHPGGTLRSIPGIALGGAFVPSYPLDVLGKGKITGGTYVESACRVYRSSTQSISHDTTTTVQFDTESYDRNTEYNTSTYTFTANRDGLYKIEYCWSLAGLAANKYGDGNILVNGGSVCRSVRESIGSGVDTVGICSTTYYLSGSATVSFSIYHNHGSSRDLNANPSSVASITFLGW